MRTPVATTPSADVPSKTSTEVKSLRQSKRCALETYLPILPLMADESVQSPVVMTFFVWLGFLVQFKQRHEMPFVKITQNNPQLIIEFTHRAPFLLEVSHERLDWTLRVMDGVPLAIMDILMNWFYSWPWTAWRCKNSVLELRSDWPAVLIRIYLTQRTQYLLDCDFLRYIGNELPDALSTGLKRSLTPTAPMSFSIDINSLPAIVSPSIDSLMETQRIKIKNKYNDKNT